MLPFFCLNWFVQSHTLGSFCKHLKPAWVGACWFWDGLGLLMTAAITWWELSQWQEAGGRQLPIHFALLQDLRVHHIEWTEGCPGLGKYPTTGKKVRSRADVLGGPIASSKTGWCPCHLVRKEERKEPHPPSNGKKAKAHNEWDCFCSSVVVVQIASRARLSKPFIRRRRRRRSEAWRRTSGSIAMVICQSSSFKVLIICHRHGNLSAAPHTEKKFQFHEFNCNSASNDHTFFQVSTSTRLLHWIPTNFPISTEWSVVVWHCCRRLLKRQKPRLPRRSERWGNGKPCRRWAICKETWTTCLALSQWAAFQFMTHGKCMFWRST